MPRAMRYRRWLYRRVSSRTASSSRARHRAASSASLHSATAIQTLCAYDARAGKRFPELLPVSPRRPTPAARSPIDATPLGEYRVAMTRGPDLTHATLSVFFIALLALATFWVLSPFLTSILWAVIVCVAMWPVLLRLETMLGGRRRVAVAIVIAMILLVVFVPV